MTRRLIHIPTLHEPEFVVWFNKSFSDIQSHALYPELVTLYKTFWEDIATTLRYEPIAALYHEALWFPNKRVLRSSMLARESSSYEMQYCQQLIRAGARVERTEGLAYLLQDLCWGRTGIAKFESLTLERFTHWRDQSIARQIHKTLRDGETGLSVIGANHQLSAALHSIAPDIKLVVHDGPINQYEARIDAILDEIEFSP